MSGDDERVATWRQLAPNWRDLWLHWDGQQGERKGEGQARVDEAERLAFVRSLVAQVCPNLFIDSRRRQWSPDMY